MRHHSLLRGMSLGVLMGALGCAEPTDSDDAPTAVADRAAETRRGYTRTDLGLDGPSAAFDVNERGQVTGYFTVGDFGPFHAFLWSPGAGMVDLGTLGGLSSTATAINDRGHVAGTSETATGEQHAFLWTPKTGMQDLGTLGGPVSFATGLNNRDMVVGGSLGANTPIHSFVWTRSAGMRDIGASLCGYNQAQAVNAGGQIVGSRLLCGTFDQTTVFHTIHHGELEDIEPLFGVSASVLAINARGQFVGSALRPDFGSGAYLFTPHKGYAVIPGLPGGGDAGAEDVSNDGTVVGIATASDGFQHAFVWTRKTGTVDLGAPGGSANGVNERGAIVGSAEVTPGVFHAVMWTPARDGNATGLR
jgi:probable HAF family extracellular repeat protein